MYLYYRNDNMKGKQQKPLLYGLPQAVEKELGAMCWRPSSVYVQQLLHRLSFLISLFDVYLHELQKLSLLNYTTP